MKSALPVLLFAGLGTGCAAVQGATKVGMTPILVNGIDGFLNEPDYQLAETALAGNIKLIEGVVATYPDDVELLDMAAMARANYAFGFLQEQLEALRLAHPDDELRAKRLLERVLLSFRAGRGFAERALAERSGYADVMAGRALEDISNEELERALETLDEDAAASLFWLAFNWGGSMQANLDPAEATQLPKIEAMAKRVLELDERVFYEIGPHMLSGVLHGFRAPALGGNPDKALEHFDRASELGGVLLPKVLAAQLVYAQSERQEEFEKTLQTVIDAEPRTDRLLLDKLAQRKACRLLANLDALFLADAKPASERCLGMQHRYRLRAEPLEEDEEDVEPEPEPATPDPS